MDWLLETVLHWLLEGGTLDARQWLWLQNDGTPAHYRDMLGSN
jgi:hypothetical protein